MKVHYCDLCDCPIHGKKYILSILEEEHANRNNLFGSNGDLKGRELCETCYNILIKLFTSRKKGLADLVKSLEQIFKMSTKPSSRGNKKKNK